MSQSHLTASSAFYKPTCIFLLILAYVLPLTNSADNSTNFCFLARNCQSTENNLQAQRTAEDLLKSGCNPNTACEDYPGSFSVFHYLLSNRCPNLLQRLLDLKHVEHPIDVNRPATNGIDSYPPLFLAGGFFTSSTSNIDKADMFSTFNVLLNSTNLDVNAMILLENSISYSLSQGLYFDLENYAALGLHPAPLFENLWSHPHLGADQRHFLLIICGFDKISSHLSPSSSLYHSARLYLAAKYSQFKRITPLSQELASSSSQIVKDLALCRISEQCDSKAFEKAGHTVEALLNNGANPNIPCPNNHGFQLTSIHHLVKPQCDKLLSKFLSIQNVTHPVDVNAKMQLSDGTLLTPLQLALDPGRFDIYHESLFGNLDAILNNPNLDINGLLPGSIPAVKHLCHLSGNSEIYELSSIALLKLLSLPQLDDEQRELLLNQCGDGSNLLVVSSGQPFWHLDMTKNHTLGSEEFSDVYLEAISTASPAAMRLPLKIVGLEGQDEGGVVATVLEHLTAAAFSFGDYEFSALNPVSQFLRISETQYTAEYGEVTKLFAPAPSSLFLFSEADNANIGDELKKKMKTAGILVGVCLNTLLFSKTLTLGVPLDRVVLQRLIDPSSPISSADALNSAVCSRASKLVHIATSLSEAELMFPGVWPDVASLSRSSPADYRKELDDYCIALVDRLLNVEESPAFRSMLDGFRSTIPVGKTSHYSFSAEFAHRMLIGYSSITMEMLQPRLHFASVDYQDTSDLDATFIELLHELSMEDSENLSRFLRQVTGSSRLRKGSSSHSVIIQWLMPGTTNAQYMISTCVSMLKIPRPQENMKESLRAVLDLIVSPSTFDSFNSS